MLRGRELHYPHRQSTCRRENLSIESKAKKGKNGPVENCDTLLQCRLCQIHAEFGQAGNRCSPNNGIL